MTTAYNKNIMGGVPYYNDFDIDKKYYQILFKPGFPIQARELSQLQSVLQNQIEKIGDHIFDEGSVVAGGGVSVSTAGFVRISTDTTLDPTTLQNMIGQTVRGTSAGVTTDAKVVSVLSGSTLESDNYQMLFVQYLTPGTFNENQSLTTVGTSNIGVTLTSLSGQSAPGVGTVSNFITVNDGIYYTGGYFAKVNRQSIPSYTDNTTLNYRVFSNTFNSVGLVKTNEVVTSDEDTSLRDPSFGFSNFNSPGADRFKVDLTLGQRGLTGSSVLGYQLQDKTDFIELVKIVDGTVTRRVKYPDYAELEKTLARRTYDESGHYTVDPFPIEIDSYQDTFGVVDRSKFGVKIGPGKAYVKGYEFETIAENKLEDDYPTETFEVVTQTVGEFDGGQYLRLRGSTDGATNRTALQKLANVLRGNQASDFDEPFIQGRKFYLFQGSTRVGSFNVSRIFEEAGSNGLIYRVYFKNFNTDTDPDVDPRNFNFRNADRAIVSSVSQDSEFGPDASGTDPEDPSSFGGAFILIDPSTDEFVLGEAKRKLFAMTEGAISIDNPVDITTIRPFVGSAVSGTVTVSNDDSSTTFVGSLGNQNGGLVTPTVWFIDSNNSAFVNNSPSFELNNSTGSLTVSGLTQPDGTTPFTGEVVVFAPVNTSEKSNKRTKTLSGDETVTITVNNSGFNANFIGNKLSLGLIDVTSISSIVVNGTDRTADFDLDDGQRIDTYQFSSISPKTSTFSLAQDDSVTVTYKRFIHSGSGPFTADSYTTVDTSDVPSFNGLKLTNYLDFRPVVHNSTVAVRNGSVSQALSADGKCEPDQDPEDPTVEIIRYGARIDSVVLTDDRKFIIIRGKPAAVPVPPEVSPNDLELYQLVIPADARSPEDVKAVYIDNQRFTMREIGDIERTQEFDATARYKSQLVNAAISRVNSAGNVAPISESGIFVDEFAGHKNADISRTNYNVSIDPIENRLYPPFVSRSVGVTDSEVTPSGVTTPSAFDNVTLVDYTTARFSAQTNTDGSAGVRERINPYASVDFLGVAKVSPFCINYWSESRKPVVVSNPDGQLNNWELDFTVQDAGGVVGRNAGFGTTWKDWEFHWFGRKFKTPALRTFVSPFEREYVASDSSSVFISRILSRRVIQRLSDRIIDLSIKPYIPATTIKVRAEGLRGDVTVFVYLDDEQIGNTDGYEVAANGVLDDTEIVIPADTFTIGRKRLTILDSADGNVENCSTSADTFFYAIRSIDTDILGVKHVRPPEVRRKSSGSLLARFEDYSDLFVAEDQQVLNSQRPLHQIFNVSPDNYPQGIHIPSIKVHFDEATDRSTPVYLSIRPVFDGIVSDSIVMPFSQVVRSSLASDILNSAGEFDDTAGTTFTFSTPVYLPAGQYAISIVTNDLSTNVFTTLLPPQDPKFGSLVVSTTDGSVVEYTNRRICCEINQCIFDTATTPTISFTTSNSSQIPYDSVYVSGNIEPVSEYQNSVDSLFDPQPLTINQSSSLGGRRTLGLSTNLKFNLNTSGLYSTMVDRDQVSLLLSEYKVGADLGSLVGFETQAELNPSDTGNPGTARYYSKIVELDAGQASDDLILNVGYFSPKEDAFRIFAKFDTGDGGDIDDNRYYELFPNGEPSQVLPTTTAAGRQQIFQLPSRTGGNLPESGIFVGEYNRYLIKVVFNYNINETDFAPYIDILAAVPRRVADGNIFFSGAAIPPGAIFPYAGNSPPSGFRFCDGTEVDASEIDLNSILNGAYGVGPNGRSLTPNLAYRVPLGRAIGDTSHIPNPRADMGQLNKTGGSNRMLDHTHAMFQNANGTDSFDNPGENETVVPPNSSVATSGGEGEIRYRMLGVDGDSGQDLASLGMVGKPNTPLSLDGSMPTASNTDGQQEQMPPYITVTYIIKS